MFLNVPLFYFNVDFIIYQILFFTNGKNRKIIETHFNMIINDIDHSYVYENIIILHLI